MLPALHAPKTSPSAPSEGVRMGRGLTLQQLCSSWSVCSVGSQHGSAFTIGLGSALHSKSWRRSAWELGWLFVLGARG